MEPAIDLALILSAIFFLGVASVLRVRLFAGRYGRRHRLVGLVYLCWLILGFLDVRFRLVPRLPYDAALGALGTALTLTAAFDFRAAHSRVRNVASGALDDDATVTFDEMIEHAFYQGQNLVQILYLHAVGPSVPLPRRALLFAASASPWLLRAKFPFNRFSDNWRKGQRRSATTLMYMVKKWQYVAYKHLLLFGLDATVCLTGSAVAGSSPDVPTFRLFWVALNAAYTCEFFLQTLVKRRYLRQGSMLLLNQLLMAASSVAAVGVLRRFVSAPLALLSLALNFRPGGRGRDFSSACAVLLVGAALAGRLGELAPPALWKAAVGGGGGGTDDGAGGRGGLGGGGEAPMGPAGCSRGGSAAGQGWGDRRGAAEGRWAWLLMLPAGGHLYANDDKVAS